MSRDKQKKFKKNWAAPQLIVLVRGNPEEGLLNACKDLEPAGGCDPDWGGVNHNNSNS